jgi:hypothetical protein
LFPRRARRWGPLIPAPRKATALSGETSSAWQERGTSCPTHRPPICSLACIRCFLPVANVSGAFFFGGEAADLPAELVWDVRGGVGVGGRLRARRLGQRDKLRQADRHVRPLRQVLSVPAKCTRSGWAGAAASLADECQAWNRDLLGLKRAFGFLLCNTIVLHRVTL